MAYLYRTCDATASSGYSQLWTWSGWVKRSKLGEQGIFNNRKNGNTTASRFKLFFNSSDKIQWECKDSSGSDDSSFQTSRVFRDTNGYYHIVFIYNSDNGTAGDRLRLYINGVRVTSFSSEDQASSGFGTLWSSSMWHYIGVANDNSGLNSSSSFEGYMSHVHFTYGYAYEPSVFGETDSTTGEWKIKVSPTVTYGTQGYFMLKNDASVNDDSGEGNNFQASGTVINAQDNPSNVFATMNPLNHDYANADTDLGAGNTFVYPRANTNYTYAMSTLAMPKGNGKFYFEAKHIEYDNVEAAVGIVNMDYASDIFYQNRRLVQASSNTGIGRVLANSDGHSIISGTANSSYGLGSWSDGDIICMACDMENGAFYFRKNNGSWANSGDPTSGSSKTGAIDISATSQWTSSSFWGVWCGDDTSNHDRFAFNFGNGFFASQSGSFGSQTYSATAVSSAGSNASGNGTFEFDCPAGYTALSTKGLNL
jgi:hypothetical protein